MPELIQLSALTKRSIKKLHAIGENFLPMNYISMKFYYSQLYISLLLYCTPTSIRFVHVVATVVLKDMTSFGYL